MQVDKQGFILLVDDDVAFSRLVRKYLEDAGLQVRVAHDGEQAVRLVAEEAPMLIVLDLMLPGIDGLTVCREVRQNYLGPIIMLTALNDDIDEVVGLEVGADDYIGKPVKPRTLLARIRAMLRRVEDYDEARQVAVEQNIAAIEVGDLVIDQRNRSVRHAGVPLALTDAEFDLLCYLASRAGEVISREEVYRNIFRFEYDGIDRTLDIRISRLRKKLGDDVKTPGLIKTIRSKGYLMVTGQ